MTKKYEIIQEIPIARLFLQFDNPRFEAVENEDEAIERLCLDENVYPLATDIVEEGLNPLEYFAMVPVDSAKRLTAKSSFYVAEGNRRLCAIKLLNDPDRAPAKFKKPFQKLAENWEPISSVPGVVFHDQKRLRTWLDRLHGGEIGGIGRKSWNSEQKQRFAGEGRNQLAQSILDYAEDRGLITKDQRKGKLTTVQRFMSNQLLREAIGIDASDLSNIKITRPADEVDKLLSIFFGDLLNGEKVNSRKNKPQIVEYSREIVSETELSGERHPPRSLGGKKSDASKRSKRKKVPPPPENKYIAHEIEISESLERLDNYKLRSLYHSITDIELKGHCPLIAVGVWSFFETMSAVAGRKNSTDFVAFFSKTKLQSYGLSGQAKPIRSALGRIQEFGNHTKHHPISAAFNGEQINNDMATLKDLVIKCLEEAEQNKT